MMSRTIAGWTSGWVFGLALLITLPTVCYSGPHEKRLLHHLLDAYNVLERPVVNESDPLQLSFGLTLMQIIDVTPQSMDAVQLTTILTAFGYHLDSFDFDIARSDRTAAQDVQVEIRCNKSGILSKLTHKPAVCTCPTEETALNNSYWEIQGSAPNHHGAEVHEASSNLLPQLSPRVVQFSRNLIKIMLMAMDAKEEKDENGNQIKLIATNGHTNGDQQLMSPTPSSSESSSMCTTPLSSVNVTPTKAEDFVASAIGVPKIVLSCALDAPSPGPSESSSMAILSSPVSDTCAASTTGKTEEFHALPLQERDQVVNDEKNQLLITNIWLKLEWNDMNLRWNSSEYGGVRDLRIPPHRLWKPDVLMYNSADEGFDGTYPTNVVVRNNGSCLYVPPGIFKSTCKIDITWFPFDDQRCEMKFGSWTYDGFQLDLQLQDEGGGDISSFITNGEWELLGVPGKRNEIYYNCCPEPYIDITFAILIRRKTLYYFFNLIVPCVLIASMALLGFTLPPDSGEKLSLGVTILLSLTVFLNMVAETMPATSDAVPLLGTYFNCIMFMVASSVVSTILILNYHHRNADTHEMSEWIRVVFLLWLPCLLRMSRPNQEAEEMEKAEKKAQQIQSVELKERSSKSLLANVLDIDDDFRCNHRCSGATLPHQQPTYYRTVYRQGDDGSVGPVGDGRMHETVSHTCLSTSAEYELALILKELRFITDQLRKEDEDGEITKDWKFAAMVVDRLCLIIFTLFTLIATLAVLISAPNFLFAHS